VEYEATVEGLYDLDHNEQVGLALEALLIAHGPKVFIVCEHEGEWKTVVPGVWPSTLEVSNLVREGVDAIQAKLA
jgi:hypothetical protein